MQDQLGRLATLIGDDNLSTDPQLLLSHGLDWTRFYEPNPCAVVFPRTREMVQTIVRFANEEQLALVPSGGRTGLSGGAVARQGELVVSFDKMNKILSFNQSEQTVEVEAGAVTQAIQAFAIEHDLFYPVDFASSGSSQIGGNIATNAGGIKVIRYGLTRDWILGLTVVTGSGELLELNKGLVKNATGYDLRHLFIGSEGTLGFIVGATVRLTKPQNQPSVMLLAVPNMRDVIAVLNAFRNEVNLSAFEFLSENGLQKVLSEQGGEHPFSQATNYYALLEFDAPTESDLEAAMAAFESSLESGLIVDGVLSQNEQQRQKLWSYRERISESITPYTPYKNDIAVRVSKVPEFLDAVDRVVQSSYPEFEIVWFGHIGDGNVHLNILKPESWAVETFKAECEKVSVEIMAIVQEYGGSISAEHGVGLLKKDQLRYSRNEEELSFMRAIKKVFDPAGIMNPGKLL